MIDWCFSVDGGLSKEGCDNKKPSAVHWKNIYITLFLCCYSIYVTADPPQLMSPRQS